MTFLYFVLFIVSLIALVKASDSLIDTAKSISLYYKLPTFVIGILIVGVGTSLPELASSIFAVFSDAPEIVLANVIGSNLANILLIVGLTAMVAKNIKVNKELIDLDIPMLAVSTALFWVVAKDGSVTLTEAGFLLAGLLYYFTYLLSSKRIRVEKEEVIGISIKKEFVKTLALAAIIALSAKYLILATVKLSFIFGVGADTVALLAVALGTSLPELFVSISAVKKGQSEMALGNIFGSNAFNMLAVAGVPALFATLPASGQTLSFALPLMLVATALFAVSGISRKIHSFEGVFYLIIYAYFVFVIIV